MIVDRTPAQKMPAGSLESREKERAARTQHLSIQSPSENGTPARARKCKCLDLTKRIDKRTTKDFRKSFIVSSSPIEDALVKERPRALQDARIVPPLSNCSESGGEPDAMLDMHHPGTGIDSHHPQFHNSYGVTYRHFVANESTALSDPNAKINGPMVGPFLSPRWDISDVNQNRLMPGDRNPERVVPMRRPFFNRV
ncbi:hypothetical protein G5I_01144 [Acromyrmex echinatior]|uniref:Uncharacterized protein n=1 Tax=Acromyrmex echinatior TaxID=103372 RepID=F4W6T9_ACREC|nr:hypothetical protein G5I_01144 [Acromyrmex echinatior]